MEEIKKNLLNRALSMLTATGSTFAVIDADGAKHGTLEVVPPKPARTRVVSGIKYRPMFAERLAAIVPSDMVHEFIVPDGLEVEAYRGALSGNCSQLWGKGNHSTQIIDRTIHLMRWA